MKNWLIQRHLGMGFVIALILPYPLGAQEIHLAGVEFKAFVVPKMTKKQYLSESRATKKWHELHGSINSRYVYLMVKKTGQRDITGYLFDAKGNKQYVYGEWFNRQLLIYDQANNRLNVILHK